MKKYKTDRLIGLLDVSVGVTVYCICSFVLKSKGLVLASIQVDVACFWSFFLFFSFFGFQPKDYKRSKSG